LPVLRWRLKQPRLITPAGVDARDPGGRVAR
jgi:hypothetical protein